MPMKDLLGTGHCVRYSPLVEEELSMTLQVGLIGTDGIVLGSDRKIQRGAVTFLSSKLRADWKRGVATCGSSKHRAFMK
jgi:hypothetical protein